MSVLAPYKNRVIAPMTPDEALAWKAQVGGTANQLRILLFEGYERGAWEPLGYANWTECLWALAEEYGFTERRLWQLHAANQSEKLLNRGSVGTIPERQLRPLTRLQPEIQPIVFQEAVATAPNGKVTAAHVENVVRRFIPPGARDDDAQILSDLPGDEFAYTWTEPPAQRINIEDEFGHVETVVKAPSDDEQDGDEYYTPRYIIDAARAVLGDIDLDPASCALAQTVVQARRYFDKEIDGLSETWRGHVWLNPPFSKPTHFVLKAIEEYTDGSISEAILLVNNGTETSWGQALLARFPVCFVGASEGHGSRIAFWNKDPDQPRKGNRYAQMIFYLGEDPQRFCAVFSQFGVIKE